VSQISNKPKFGGTYFKSLLLTTSDSTGRALLRRGSTAAVVGNAGSNPNGEMYVCLLWVLYVVR